MLGAGATRAAEVGMARFCRSRPGWPGWTCRNPLIEPERQRRADNGTLSTPSRRFRAAKKASTSSRSARLAASAVLATMALRRAPCWDSTDHALTRPRSGLRGLSEVMGALLTGRRRSGYDVSHVRPATHHPVVKSA